MLPDPGVKRTLVNASNVSGQATAEWATRGSSPLLELPWEVRENIFHHLLIHRYPIKLWSPSYVNNAPLIFMTCKQLYKEASEFWFSNNIISVGMEQDCASRSLQEPNFEARAGLIFKLCLKVDLESGTMGASPGIGCQPKMAWLIKTFIYEKEAVKRPVELKELVIRHSFNSKMGKWDEPTDSTQWHLAYLEPLLELKGKIRKLTFLDGKNVQGLEGLQGARSEVERLLMP